ncbi:MAG: nucleoside permease [Saprospiraceae bacterium]|uniref:Nucleoside permease n=1 Tax=Candidatus Opimibacter skivensis TaxID=2982028 RepID=A0A9D7SY29_9BACT|nr:nucleoside permease [Candidatus Opimibacter skivensis]
MNSLTRFKLSLMMFLEFFIWGAWFVTMGTYLSQALSSEGFQIAAAYSTQSLGAIIAPFIIGLIADRYFAAQRILGFLHIVGAILLFMVARADSFSGFYPYILAYMILYMPTLALVNSVSFRQMNNPSKQFASIRVWGTIGWIVAGLIIGYVMKWETKGLLRDTFYMASGVSAFLGVFSFLLPDTPPQGNTGTKPSLREILGLDALNLLKDKNFLWFFIASILICIPLAFYYQNANMFLNATGIDNAAGIMSFGQVSEVAFMLLLPLFFKRFGLKITLLVGMAAWAVRYLLFAYGDSGQGAWMLLLGILMHGVCYDFFFVSGQIYTDIKAGEKIKSSAQGLITLATYGLGMFIGFWLAGNIYNKFQLADGAHDWRMIWVIPAGIAFVVLLSFALVFKNEKITSEPSQHQV